jgi:hypothetical protein
MQAIYSKARHDSARCSDLQGPLRGSFLYLLAWTLRCDKSPGQSLQQESSNEHGAEASADEDGTIGCPARF